MIIIKIDSATNLEKGLKTLKHKVLKTKQNESLKNRKEYEKKSIKIRTQKKKAIVFMISDFMSDDYEQTLKIASKKHDITGIRVYDIREEKIPNIGMVSMQDAETGAIQWVNTGSKAVRLNYEKYYQSKISYFKETFSKSGSGVVNTRVDESYVTKLLGYFKSR
jgi:ribosomal protein S21